MTEYGMKLISASGKEKTVTPDEGTVIAAGSLAMSNSLEGDNTYGEDIALGATYDENELSVLVVPRRPIYGVTYNRFIDGGTLNYATFYLDSGKTYYTRNTATGVMTSFSAGNKTVGSKSTWNPVLSVFPTALWDKMGASSFSSVRLFAATAYLIRDPANDTNFSLAGSASGSGGDGGGNGNTVNNIKDNNDLSWYGMGCFVMLGNSCSWNYWAEVTFSSKTLNRVEMLHRPYSEVNLGNYANGSFTVKIYYSGGYHTILTGSWSGNYNPVGPTDHIHSWVIGHWKGVTKIRVEASGSAQAGGGFGGWAVSEHVTHELRAVGPGGSDAAENKVVYSIGNQGIATVDYMVCRKRYVV